MSVSDALAIAHTDGAAPFAVQGAAAVLAAVVEQIRQIHVPSEPRTTHPECAGCHLDGQENPYDWPCAEALLLGDPHIETTVRWER